MSKRKRTVLSFKDKFTITERLRNGESVTKLALEFGIGKPTVCELKKQKESIANFIIHLDSTDGSTMTMKLAENKKLDEAVYKWFLQKRMKGEPITLRKSITI